MIEVGDWVVPMGDPAAGPFEVVSVHSDQHVERGGLVRVSFEGSPIGAFTGYYVANDLMVVESGVLQFPE